MTTQFSETNKKIIALLSRYIAREMGSVEIASWIGSWGDTLDDEEILAMLEDMEDSDLPIIRTVTEN